MGFQLGQAEASRESHTQIHSKGNHSDIYIRRKALVGTNTILFGSPLQ